MTDLANIQIKNLPTLSDEDFRKVVDADLRRRDGDPGIEVAMALRSPDLVRRYHGVLLRMLKSVEGQLAARETDYEGRRARLKAKLGIAKSNLERARKTTTAELYTVEGKVLNLEAELETDKSKYLADRGKILRFKTGLDMALIEARTIIDQMHDGMYDSIVARERNYYAARCAELEAAIQQHQTDVHAENADDPLEADLRLWKILQETEAGDGEPDLP